MRKGGKGKERKGKGKGRRHDGMKGRKGWGIGTGNLRHYCQGIDTSGDQ